MSAGADLSHITKSALLLLLILACGLLFRLCFATCVMVPPPRMQGETTQAYRYAQMVSRGSGIPARDSLVLHPRGFVTSKNSILEEYLAGWLHRLTGGDFNSFIRGFSLLLPLLAGVGVFLWIKASGFRRREALLCAAAYSVLLPALLRARGESLYRETLALPLLALLGAALERSLRGGGRGWHAASGGLLLLSLAAWKVTMFLAVFLFGWILYRQMRRRKPPKGLVLFLAGAQIAGSALIPHLRWEGALLSPATALAFAAAAGALAGRFEWQIATAGLLLAAAGALAGPRATGHVTAVILAKLTHPGGHPADPLALSPDARLFWVSGYTSPSPSQVIWLLGIPAAVAAAGALRRDETFGGGLILPFAALSFAGYIFFDRLVVFAALAMALLMAKTFSRGRLIPALGMLLLGAQSFTAPMTAGLMASAGGDLGGGGSMLTEGELSEVLQWARTETDGDDAFLCYWHLSGMMSAYARRPVVTHTFFESPENRARIHRFARSIYLPEDSLLAMMRETEANYVIYQADFLFDRSPQGLLYLSGRREIPDGSACILMHYAPDMLDSLVPVFRGRSLSVFERGAVGLPPDSARRALFEPVYYQLFGDSYPLGVAAMVDPAGTARRLALSGRDLGDPVRLSAALTLMADAGSPADDAVAVLSELASLHLRGGWSMDRLREDFSCYLYAWGPDPQARLDLAQLLAQAGRMDGARRQLELVADEHGESSRTQALRRALSEGNSHI